jgi:hypothetical protein
MKTFVIYLVSNILFLPLYFTILITGVFGTLMTKGDINFYDILPLLLIITVPNLFVFISVHFLVRRWNLSKKLNILFFVMISVSLLYYTISEIFDARIFF